MYSFGGCVSKDCRRRIHSIDGRKNNVRKKSGTKQRVFWDLPLDLRAGVARVTALGFDLAVVEHHDGLLEYSQTRVRFATGEGELLIIGQNLVLDSDGTGDARITGRIASIVMQRWKAHD